MKADIEAFSAAGRFIRLDSRFEPKHNACITNNDAQGKTMKKIALLALCALPFAFSQVQASGLAAEPATTAYWEIPLDTPRSGKPPQAFGLRMDQVVHDNNLASVLSSAARVPVVDFRFNASGMQGVYVRGVNMARPDMMKLGIEEAVLWIVGGAALGATALIVEANNHGGTTTPANDCGPIPEFALNACVGLNVSCCR
jgi:hypothetical protein